MTLTMALAATGTVKWGAATMVTSTATTTMEALQLLHLPQALAEGIITQKLPSLTKQRKQANIADGLTRITSQ